VTAPLVTTAALLQNELDQRVHDDKSYSRRRFAKDLGVSPAYVTLILKGSRIISEERAREFAVNLKLPRAQAAILIATARYESAATPAQRQVAREGLEALTMKAGIFKPLAIDRFKLVSRWYHNAIFSLVACRGFVSDVAWIAKRLRISVLETDLAVDRLTRSGMLRRDKAGQLHQQEAAFSTGDIPSEAIRAYHPQMLQLAAAALDTQTPDQRDISGVTVPIDVKKLPEFRALIRDFRRDLTKIAMTGDKSAVYHLTVGFFRLDQDVADGALTSSKHPRR
jgi:uncharacterized protein (TIGR02147 family)